ncbi:hypothetical protein FRC11_010279 [Ceratobasidium sp. 423]|nr:hypothetical protein FRC11_010279 [Ceratobasidium sp. 423]
MGPLISSSALARAESAIANLPAHARILHGGKRLVYPSQLDSFPLSNGNFFSPTLVGNVQPTDTLWTEEVFGPVVALAKFQGEEHAINLANACKYGLGAGIWTRDVGRAVRVSREIEAGLVWVNAHHRNDPSSPWGGMKESGIGRENGVEAFESYSQSKSTIICTSTVEEMRAKDDWFAEGDEERRGLREEGNWVYANEKGGRGIGVRGSPDPVTHPNEAPDAIKVMHAPSTSIALDIPARRFATSDEEGETHVAGYG